MKHLVYKLGHKEKGETVVVQLDKQANVLLMDSSNYNAYKGGRRYRYYGGSVKKSPFRIAIPRNGNWVVAIDLGGYPGTVRASVQVMPKPRGNLPLARPMKSVANHIQLRDPVPPPDGVLGDQTWDVFLSHASEDKETVVLPLCEELKSRGVSVWLDKTEIRIGDSLRRKIDQGISASKFSVVVLSPSFLRKGWTNHELDGLVTRTVAGEQTMLPIWHEITGDEIRAYSPSLADKLAVSTSEYEISEIADQVAEAVLGDKEG